MLFQALNLYQSNQSSLEILRINHPQTGWLLLHDLLMFYFFVCLFGIFRPIRELFTQMETSPLPVRGWHSWQLSSEGSSVCHTYCDTEHPFIMVISEDPWHSHLLPSVYQWNCHFQFLRLMSVADGFFYNGKNYDNIPIWKQLKFLNKFIALELWFTWLPYLFFTFEDYY